jgi:hypothetical protein
MKKQILVIFVGLILLTELCFAQGQTKTKAPTSNWRRNTAIVLFSGIGGSLLGLSTLSFYGRPQEHTNNITIGALLGVIGGIGYVVYENTPKKTPVRTYDYFGLFPSDEQPKQTVVTNVPTVQFEFTF